jgi:stage V sporulation protein S
MTINSGTPVKSLAGAIAHQSRKGCPPVMMALGPQCVNHAVKALAIANQYVQEDGFSLQCQARRIVDERKFRDMFEMTISKGGLASSARDTLLKCSSVSDPFAVAKAIKIGLEGDEKIEVASIGPIAVFKALDAISCVVRTGLCFIPEFAEFEVGDGDTMNGVKFQLAIKANNRRSRKSSSNSRNENSRNSGGDNSRHSRQSGVGGGKSRDNGRQDTGSNRRVEYANDQDAEDDRLVITVSSSSQVKGLAGAIAKESREGLPPILRAVGPQAVNQAVKSLAIANRYVKENHFSLNCKPKRVMNDANCRDLFEMDISKGVMSNTDDTERGCTELKCATQSNPSAVGRAIKRTIDEGEVALQSIGPVAVFKGVDSISFARDVALKEGWDISFLPEFIEIHFDDGQTANGITFNLFVDED